MIYIKIELWPFGDKNKAKHLGEMLIANDATGSRTKGNYKAVLLNSRKKGFRTGTVEDFPRKRLNVFDLMYRALKSAVGDRSDTKLKENKSKTIDSTPTFKDGTPDIGVKGLARLLEKQVTL